MEPAKVEVLQQALTPEATPTPTTPTEQRARRIIEQATEAKWPNAIEDAIGASNIDSRKVEEVKGKFGITRDPATGEKAPTPEEQGRRDAFENRTDFIERALENYDTLTDPEKGEIINTILGRAERIGFLADRISGMTTGQKEAYVRRYLKDPVYRAKLKEVVGETLGSTLQSEEDIVRAQDEVEDKKLEDSGLGTDISDIDTRLTTNATKLKDFEPAAGTGSKAARLEDLTRREGALQIDLSRLTQERNLLDAKARELQSELEVTISRGVTNGRRDIDTIGAQLDEVRDQLVGKNDEVSSVQRELAEKESLEQERQRLQDEKQDLEAQKKTKEGQRKTAKLELQRRERRLNELKSLRTKQEQDMVDGLGGSAFEEAFNRTIKEEVEQINKLYDDEDKRMAQETDDQDKKAIYDTLQNRWLARPQTRRRGLPGFRREERYRPPNRPQINIDMDILFNQGPEGFTRRVLLASVNPRTGTNYTIDEANAVIAREDFIKTVQPDAVQQLLARRMVTGGLSREEIYTITNSTWGSDMITKAAEKNQAFREAVRATMGERAFAAPGFGGRWGRELGRNPWLLLALLGIPAAIGAKFALD